MIEIINEFVVNDINKTIDFYKEYFGFELIDVDGNPITWCKMEKDNCYIMFEEYREVYNEIPNFPKKIFSSNLIKFKLKSKDEIKNLYKKITDCNFHGVKKYRLWKFGIWYIRPR